MAESVNFDTTETLNITCREGDTFSMTVTLKDSSGTALSLSTDDYSFYMQVKDITEVGRRDGRTVERVIIQTPTITKTQSDNVLFFEPPTVNDNGNVTIEASATVMSSIKPGSYLYDLKYIKPSTTGLDTHKGVLKGSFVVNSQITNVL